MKNQRRALLIIYILSIAVSTILFSFFMKNNVHDTEYTSYTKSVITSEGIYFSENMEDYALIYRMDTSGRVLDVFNTSGIDRERIHALYVYDGNLYACVSKTVVLEDSDNETVKNFSVVEFDKNLKSKRITNSYVLEDGYIVSGLSVSKSDVCTTVISSDGKQIKVLSLPADTFHSLDTSKDVLSVTESVMIKNAPQGRFFVSAIYDSGNLEYRTDEDEPLEYFAENSTISAAVSNMKLSAIQEVVMYRSYFLFWITLTIVWLIVVTFIYRTLATANRFFYSFILMELILAIVIGCSIYYVTTQYSVVRAEEHTRFGIISLQGLAPDTGITTNVDYGAEDFYNSDLYKNIQSRMAEFVERNGNSSIFYDVLVVRLVDGKVVVSASGRNNEGSVYLFGNAVSDVINTLYSGESMYAQSGMVLGGQKCRVIGISDSNFIANYALIGIINDTSVSSRFTSDNIKYIILFVFLFALGSALLTAIYYISSRDFKALENALKDSALGRTLPERPVTVGSDIKNMWDSLVEIDKRVDLINYTKIKVLEAYYRFAPKNIEFALGKETIIDVKNDSKTEISASLLTIRTARAEGEGDSRSELPGIESMIEKLESRQNQNDSIIIGNDPELAEVQMLFLNSQKGMVDFAAELIHDSNIEHKGYNSGFIFYDDFEFGVVGNSGLAFTYVLSDKNRDISQFGSFFQKLHLGLVITEYVKLRDYADKSVRYIGFIILTGKTERINLYEVMDACSQGERQAKLHTMRLFEKGFEMYEQKDFYLARNMFSDLLKESPTDELARWYLFESEKYLNEGVEDETTFGALHI